MYQLKVIITSTRPGRRGIAVANWFSEKAKTLRDFNSEVLDLKEIDLPLLDEPFHPKLQKYQQEHTKEWSKKINEGDAFVFVIPEYNYGMPPAMLNAIDFVFKEWNYKPAALVSYGGISGGLRSAQMCKLVLTTVKVMPLMEGISLPFFEKNINESGVFVSNELIDKSFHTMMDELLKWTKGMQYMRDNFLNETVH